ncbi:MAG: T9SS type A sorting domain-containing protein, partial [Chitinophagales bacterium]|nr:T9SS type A sorting domain-containing protein [Chitinophagales bacterium]
TTMQTFTQTFTAATTNSNVNLGFLLGMQGSSAGVYIDDVCIKVTTVTPPPPPPTASPLVGTWKLRPVVGALGVGPARGSVEWYSSTLDDINLRGCQFDDLYVFDSTGKFTNIFQDATWLEPWQGTDPPACGTPVAPHNGSIPATYVYSASTNTLTLRGKGAHIGVAKAANNVELTSPSQAPDSVRYQITMTSDTTMTVEINFGPGWWKYLLVKTANVVAPPPPPPAGVAKMPLTFEETNVAFIFSPINGGTTSKVANPDSTINTSKFVARTTKPSGSNAVSGSVITLQEPINTTNAVAVKMKIWSPLAFIKVRIRLEHATNPSKFIEIEQMVQNPNSWQDVEFPLPVLDTTKYSKFAIFFDVENPGTGANFFWDDVMMKVGTSSIVNLQDMEILIYPNPAQNSLKIESKNSLGDILIYDLSGKEVLKAQTKNKNYELDIHHLAPGAYFIKAIQKDTQTNIKFTKE